MPFPTDEPVVITFEQRLRCVEIAERSVYYVQQASSISVYEDKSLREILDRADRIAQYCLNADPPANLIERLRAVLCAKD